MSPNVISRLADKASPSLKHKPSGPRVKEQKKHVQSSEMWSAFGFYIRDCMYGLVRSLFIWVLGPLGTHLRFRRSISTFLLVESSCGETASQVLVC